MKELAKLKEDNNFYYDIQVDNITDETIVECLKIECVCVWWIYF